MINCKELGIKSCGKCRYKSGNCLIYFYSECNSDRAIKLVVKNHNTTELFYLRKSLEYYNPHMLDIFDKIVLLKQ